MFENKQFKVKIQLVEETISHIRAENVKLKLDIEEQNKKIDNLMFNKPNGLSVEENKRLADLEVKMSKLWTMLVEQTPTGKEKLNKFGRNFYKRN